MGHTADTPNVLKLLAIGLHEKESAFLQRAAEQSGGEYFYAENDMEFLTQARFGIYTVLLMGEKKNVSDPTYLVWLLKGIVRPSCIVLLYSSLADADRKKMKRYGVQAIHLRPFHPQAILQSCQQALMETGPRKNRFVDTLLHLVSFRPKAA
jgi:hypothetical protein